MSDAPNDASRHAPSDTQRPALVHHFSHAGRRFTLRKRRKDGGGRWYLVSVVHGRRYHHALAAEDVAQAEAVALLHLAPAIARHAEEAALAQSARKQVTRVMDLVESARQMRVRLVEELKRLEELLEGVK